VVVHPGPDSIIDLPPAGHATACPLREAGGMDGASPVCAYQPPVMRCSFQISASLW
jgi:hypothetical protein